MAIKFNGTIADVSQIEDGGLGVAEPISGKHAGHSVTIETAKHNCGAYQEDVTCSCGATFHNRMNGCWQYGHQREQSGDESLEDIVDTVYNQQ